jgi:hypothetical protein
MQRTALAYSKNADEIILHALSKNNHAAGMIGTDPVL